MHRKQSKAGRVAYVLISLLVSAQLLPSIALACEGGGAEPQKISIKGAESGEGAKLSKTKKCPEVLIGGAPFVEFKKVTEWCEYEVANENKAEAVKIEAQAIGEKIGGECLAIGGCLGEKVPAGAQCKNGGKIAAKAACFVKLEYTKKPAKEEETNFVVTTKSEPNGAKEITVTSQIEK